LAPPLAAIAPPLPTLPPLPVTGAGELLEQPVRGERAARRSSEIPDDAADCERFVIMPT